MNPIISETCRRGCPPTSPRKRTAIIAVLLATLATGCGDNAGSFTPPANLLQPEDLPSSPTQVSATSEPPPIATWCEPFESVYGPAFKTVGVTYESDGATVVSTLGQEPSPTLDRQRIEQTTGVLTRCAQTSPERGLEVLDLGTGRVGFRAPAYEAAQAPAGSVAIAEVNDSYVMVAILTEPDSDPPDLVKLLDAAVARADSPAAQ